MKRINLFYNPQNKGTRRPLWSNTIQTLGLRFAVWMDPETKNLSLYIDQIPPQYRKANYRDPMDAVKEWLPSDKAVDQKQDLPF